jgi:hypothetical protein
MAKVTEQQVKDKAKELSVELTPEQIAAHVMIGRLPEKEEADSSTGDEGDEDETTGADKDKIPKDRLDKVIAQRNAERKRAKDLADKVAELEAKVKTSDRSDAEKKGDYEKLLAETKAEQEKVKKLADTVKDRQRSMAISGQIKASLLEAGVPAARLAKALKLFDADKVEFSWTNEETLEFEIEDFSDLVEEFKKDNDFLFGDAGGGADENRDAGGSASGFRGNSQPKGGGKGGDKAAERITNKLAGLGL